MPGNLSAGHPPTPEHPPLPQRLLYASSPTPVYTRPSFQSTSLDTTYCGPRPTTPSLSQRDPGEFAHLKLALENLLPPDSTELFNYQVPLDHLKLEEARLATTTPFTDTIMALNEQPYQLAFKRIAIVMDSSDIR